MDRPRRILILTADDGFGHRSAANAVAAAFKQQYAGRCQVDIINPIDDPRVAPILRESAADYDRIVRLSPQLYQLGYDASDYVVPSAIMESALTLLLYEVMRDLIDTHQPDAILTTYPLYQIPLLSVYAINRRHIPLVTTVTDLATVHRTWFVPRVDACVVPTPIVQGLALSHGLGPDQIHPLGIPVNPLFAAPRPSKAELRARLGWDPNLLTVLAVGSRRVDRLVDALNVVNHFGAPLQAIAVAGRDAELFAELRSLEWHIPAHVYEFAANIPEMMLAADLIICKAGGLIVTEALAAGLPLLLVDAIPGQETGNAAYVVENGAGELVQSPVEILQTLGHWLGSQRQMLDSRMRQAASLGHPRAALDVADLLWTLAQRGPADLSRRRIIERSGLIDLLTSNHIPWDFHPVLTRLTRPGDRSH